MQRRLFVGAPQVPIADVSIECGYLDSNMCQLLLKDPSGNSKYWLTVSRADVIEISVTTMQGREVMFSRSLDANDEHHRYSVLSAIHVFRKFQSYPPFPDVYLHGGLKTFVIAVSLKPNRHGLFRVVVSMLDGEVAGCQVAGFVAADEGISFANCANDLLFVPEANY